MSELARAESERGELILRSREGDVLELRANGVFVMDTHETSTERAMAHGALALHPAPTTVLVGGLGLGFTAAEVLADPRVERCDVAEIEAALVDWMRAGVVPHGPDLLAEPRLAVLVDDVARVVDAAGEAAYDLVLLDVDNGPGYLVHDANAALYRAPFLRRARRVLRPGGVLVVWSASAAPDLLEALHGVFADVREESHVVLLGPREDRYWLYVARA